MVSKWIHALLRNDVVQKKTKPKMTRYEREAFIESAGWAIARLELMKLCDAAYQTLLSGDERATQDARTTLRICESILSAEWLSDYEGTQEATVDLRGDLKVYDQLTKETHTND